jgi:hypothetical protein
MKTQKVNKKVANVEERHLFHEGEDDVEETSKSIGRCLGKH